MPDDLLSRALRVEDRKAAAAFSDPMRRRLIMHLAGEARSIAELAAITGVELKRLHYHVSALLTLGLLVVAGQRARVGRPVKLYRAAAPAFFIPVEAMAAAPNDALATELRVAQARLAEQSRDGMLYHRSECGEPKMRPVSGQPGRSDPSADVWRVLQLSPIEARRLAAELRACIAAAAERGRGGGRTYLVHVALAPRLDRTQAHTGPQRG